MNCWDFKQCGAKESCPAYPLHGKKCALVLGTLCHGERQNDFNDKTNHCITCDYFKSEHHVRTID